MMKNQKSKSLCKIYSRRRMANFGFYKNNNIKQKSNSFLCFFVILIIIIFVYIEIERGIEPIFRTLCEDKAQEIATSVTNAQSTKVMEKYKYNDMFTIEKDSSGNVQMINANIFVIDEITSDIALYIQKELEKNPSSEIKLSISSFTGIKMLSGMGPNINMRIAQNGKVNTDLKSEFVSQGINQTIHRVYLQIYCSVNILTPFEIIEKEISNQVLLMENVIIGQIPNTFYNFNGLESKQNLMEFVE